jgi:3',5'-cyclic AMP phosphodiesterase CpdA
MTPLGGRRTEASQARFRRRKVGGLLVALEPSPESVHRQVTETIIALESSNMWTSRLPAPRLLAISDLHFAFPENRRIVEDLWPQGAADWLVVAGDVGERFADIERALRVLSARFGTVLWAPGNHELWTSPRDEVQLRGEKRYGRLVDLCRSLGVFTPEDPYPVWEGAGGPVTVAPLFVLYDYTFRPPGTSTKEEGLARAYASGVVCTDEWLLHPDPYPSREDWCRARTELTERRLNACDRDLPVILVNHFPLVREPTRVLQYSEFAQWCGTEGTADWHIKFNAAAVVYGHLHIPRTTWHDGVRFEEVSLGYPREWQARKQGPAFLRQILPASGRSL